MRVIIERHRCFNINYDEVRRSYIEGCFFCVEREVKGLDKKITDKFPLTDIKRVIEQE